MSHSFLIDILIGFMGGVIANAVLKYFLRRALKRCPTCGRRLV